MLLVIIKTQQEWMTTTPQCSLRLISDPFTLREFCLACWCPVACPVSLAVVAKVKNRFLTSF